MDLVIYLVPAIVVGLAVYAALKVFKKKGSGLKAVRVNLCLVGLFAVACVISSFVASASGVSPADIPVSAADTAVAAAAAAATAAPMVDPTKGLGMLGAALVTGLSGIGGGIAVAAAAPAAIGATSEDPKAFGKALIFVALGESIALYGLVISIMILGKY